MVELVIIMIAIIYKHAVGRDAIYHCSSPVQDLAQVDTSCQHVVDTEAMTPRKKSCLSTLLGIGLRIQVSACW